MKYRALYSTMHDDLKDAEMLIDYACEIKEQDENVADILAKYALQRYNHFLEFHSLFVEEVKKEKDFDKTDISKCLWDTTHEHYHEWAQCIKKKIDKY